MNLAAHLSTPETEETAMKEHPLTFPQIALIAGTRGLLGAGIGLLLSEFLEPRERRAIGWTLVAVGALTTIPLAMQVFNSKEPPVSAYVT
jgi:hypothetical protein